MNDMEIVRLWNQSKISMNRQSLSSIKDCPDYLLSNRFIYTGYRLNYTKLQCLRSIFSITNETINIWTHLIGFLLFIFFIFHINFHVLSMYNNITNTDHIVTTLFCLCFAMCLLLSTCFHTFCCHSKDYYEQCLRYDLMGISLSLWGCYIPSIYYGFYCHKLWQSFYTLGVVVMMLLNLAFQYVPKKIYTTKTDYRRIIFFCLLCLFGIVPAIHWIYLLGGFRHELVQCFIPRVLLMYTLGASAFFFYLTKIPEKWYPGYFDFIGASHQIWHILILIAFVWWYYSTLTLIDVRLGENDSCLLEK